jgi:hypothetical protein
MAFDVSSITSAVNKYLYSISDVNKLLTQGTNSSVSEGTDSSKAANFELTGLFQKYLTGAIRNAASGAGNLNSNEIASAMLSLSNGVTADKTAIDKLSSKDNMTDLEVSKALSTLKGLSTGLDSGSSNSSSSLSDLDLAFGSSLPDLTGLGKISESSSLISLLELLRGTTGSETGISDEVREATGKELAAAIKAAYANKANNESQQTSSDARDASSQISSQFEDQFSGSFKSLNLEAEIESAFAGMDNLQQQIQNKIASRDITGEINKSIDNLDIKGDIQRSIASHDRSDEINAYNATRLKNYKKQTSGTSVFGDYRL